MLGNFKFPGLIKGPVRFDLMLVNRGANWYNTLFSEGKRMIPIFFVQNPSSFPNEIMELIMIETVSVNFWALNL